MSETRLLQATLDQLMVGTDPASLWDELEKGGFSRVGVPVEAGGSGGTIEQSHAVFERVGSFAAAVPVVETLVAGWLCAEAGLELPAGTVTVAPARPGDDLAVTQDAGGWMVSGVAHRVPWARSAEHIVIAVPHVGATAVAIVPSESVAIEHGRNLAREPRDTVTFADVTVSADHVGLAPGLHLGQTLIWGAMARAVQTAGAAARVIELTRGHVLDRVQFGRPLASFQQVRLRLAEMAAEAAVAQAAAEAAMVHTGGRPGPFEVAAAKVRTARAARVVAAAAHQLHGAIGFTDEHRLHTFTTRLWSWRDEYGTERWWAERLGRMAVSARAEGTWDFITSQA